MSDVGLKIVIGADLKDSIQQVGQLTASVTNLGGAVSAAGGIANSLAAIPAALRPINPAGIQALSAAVTRLKADVAGTGGIKALPDALNRIPPAANAAALSLERIRPASVGAGQALIDVGRVAQDLPFGFIGIQNNIQPLFDSFARLKAETGSTKGALLALGSSIGGVGGVGLAISLVTSAITLASIGFDRWIPKIKGAGDSLKKAQENLESLLKPMGEIRAESIAGVDDEIAKVSALAGVIGDQTKSYLERNNALDQLKNVNKNYFGDLTFETTTLQTLTEKVNDYTKALIAQSVVKGFEQEIGKVSVEKSKQTSELNKQIDAYDKLKRSVANFNLTQQAGPTTSLNASSAGFGPGRSLNSAKEAIEEQKKVVKSLDDQYILLGDQIKKAVEESVKFKSITGTDDGKKGTGKKAKEDTDALKEAIKNLEDYQKEVGLTNVEFQRLLDLRVQLVQRDASKLGLDPSQLAKEITAIRNSNELLEARKKTLDELQKSIGLIQSEKVAALNIGVNIALNDQAVGKLDLNQTQRTLDQVAQEANLRLPLALALDATTQDRIRKAVGELPVIGLPVQLNIDSTHLKEQRSAINTGLATSSFTLKADVEINGKSLQKSREATEAFVKDINNTLRQISVDAIASLGEAIGTALAGGGVQNALGAFMNVLANGLQEIGRAVIQLGITKKVIEDLHLKGAAAIVAGVALVAAGAALKTSINRNQQKFALGGVVTGPTNALIGEAGPEAVLPLRSIPNMIKHMAGAQGGQIFIPEVRISGTDLQIIFTRANKRDGGTFNG